MNTSLSVNKSLVALAHILQRLEHSGRPVDAEQYRTVVSRLEAELKAAPPDALEPLLRAMPSVAELYENLQYVHAGLCRSPLEAGLNAELEARRLIDVARRPARPT
ncbi:hypothetical protein JI739_14950 [Ramlibacter sp. AW1]|uniref:Uncharacterized protein n=1 Tax=Ramlibacter aurantiacus TaxID=2801330 RepID=A0A936ZQJ9_9BURK|nr:hypothetical protein [Ramlibacter aurantiacus]MBL0421653.1 hypothetical protein [Ramlibacter aurantiacus]